jgi:hypothetical protein
VYYGTLAAASTRSGSAFDMTVGAGSPGDPLDLVLLMTDSTRSYEIPLPFVLGEPFWQSMSVSEDAPSDPLTSGNFDFTNGEFRVVDDSLQIRLHSYTVFDPSTLFIESWGLSSGAEWIYYRLVLQAGSVTLQGYDESGFHTIGEASVTFPDAYTVEFDLPVSSLGLLLTEISFGWGSGWCGPPDYYCDQWPDAWGYPYDSFTTSNWMELSW